MVIEGYVRKDDRMSSPGTEDEEPTHVAAPQPQGGEDPPNDRDTPQPGRDDRDG